MKTNFKKYKFKIDGNIDIKTLRAYQSIKLKMLKIDDEILLTCTNGGGDFSLYLQDRFLYFGIENETKRVSSFNGELTYLKIKTANLFLPKTIKNTILKLDTNDNLVAGTGSYLEFNKNDVFYDKEHKILQIGKIFDADVIYKIFSNAFIQIKNGEIVGLILTKIEL